MTTPVITNEIHVCETFQGIQVSFKTIEECHWVRRKLETMSPVLETIMPTRYMIRLHRSEYSKFLDNLTKWEEEGYISVN